MLASALNLQLGCGAEWKRVLAIWLAMFICCAWAWSLGSTLTGTVLLHSLCILSHMFCRLHAQT